MINEALKKCHLNKLSKNTKVIYIYFLQFVKSELNTFVSSFKFAKIKKIKETIVKLKRNFVPKLLSLPTFVTYFVVNF